MIQAKDNSITCRSSASGLRLGNQLVSPDPSSLPSLLNNIGALALPHKRVSASFQEDSSPAVKRARLCSYLQEALDLGDTTLLIINEDYDSESEGLVFARP